MAAWGGGGRPYHPAGSILDQARAPEDPRRLCQGEVSGGDDHYRQTDQLGSRDYTIRREEAMALAAKAKEQPLAI